MARLQILELPEGTGDDRPPFVLVVDQADYDSLSSLSAALEGWQNVKDQIGARAVLVFEETVDIPANDTSAYVSGGSLPADAHYEMTIGGQPVTWTPSDETQARAAEEAQRLAHERTDIARDMDRLAKWKRELLEALGVDRTRDWDDIRNAARGLRQERDAQAEALERVRNLHRPVEHNGQAICWECSAYDFQGLTTDNAPVAHDQCGTLRALASQQEQA